VRCIVSSTLNTDLTFENFFFPSVAAAYATTAAALPAEFPDASSCINTRTHTMKRAIYPCAHSAKRTLYSIKRALYYIKKALHFMKRVLFSMKRAIYTCVHSVKRTLYSIKRALYSVKKTLHSIKRVMYSMKRALDLIKRDLYSITIAYMSRCAHSLPTYLSNTLSKQPYVSSKELYILSNQPSML